MPRAKLKGVNTVKKRLSDGTVRRYYYHRASGTPLPSDPNSREFLLAYAEAEKARPKDAGTIAALIRSYSLSLKFERLATSTQKEYRRILTKLEDRFGTMPIAALASPKVRRIFLDYHEEIGREHPREADNRMTLLQVVFNYAISRGELRDNPIVGLERLHRADRAEFVWTERDVTGFMKDAPAELQQALVLAICTGQRYGDLIRLRWADYDGNAITLRQRKTGARVNVRCLPTLRAMLDGMPKRGPFILTRPDGRPWFTEKNDKALSKAWREHARAAGITELHFHDLRGTAVTTMNEAGLTPQQIASVTGHTFKSVLTILERYSARTQRLSDAAMLAWENAQATGFANPLQTTPLTAEAVWKKEE
ncbi:tyrosine-type recombinase/integrase [Oceanicella sp. SM1341]|uniref:tyrosine-type recombinase/integrase n=1 Tax=Oceanicella sp. SM1341 TaxID=1548889 RepID=UPI000E54979A|nr:tyrosine-type recombinase/integrase [Oceanicella sp. SM1341]